MTYPEYALFIGTYGKQGSKHLYRTTIDRQTGQFRELAPFVLAQQSSALIQTPDGKILSLLKSGDRAGLAVFSAQGDLISQVLEEPLPACHLTYLLKEGVAYTANYHTGDILTYEVSSSGQLNLTSRLQLGSDSHPHFVGQTTDGLLLVALMGQDRLACYKTNGQTWTAVSQLDLPPGTGPRQLVFHPDKKMVYLLGEKDNRLHILFYDGCGEFELYRSLDTLPEGTTGDSWAGSLSLTPDGRFLYVSNRGHDSLVRFDVLSDGDLALGEWLTLPGQHPRALTISPQGDWLLVACLNSNLVLSLAIDPKTGKLKPSSQLEVHEPVALLVQNP